uniref:Exuperantia RNAse H-like domain-containing protein n=1 Tax=Timema cristinae TaxID=61476 RepID=A0A7R9CSR5_TIMCR|nr:unnamed protein product [Timema cristinae]
MTSNKTHQKDGGATFVHATGTRNMVPHAPNASEECRIQLYYNYRQDQIAEDKQGPVRQGVDGVVEQECSSIKDQARGFILIMLEELKNYLKNAEVPEQFNIDLNPRRIPCPLCMGENIATRSKPRGKKIQIEAGKSVRLSENDINENSYQEDVQCSSKQAFESSNSSDSGETVVKEILEPSISSNLDEPDELPDFSVNIDDFLLVKFDTNKRDRFFIGKIVKQALKLIPLMSVSPSLQEAMSHPPMEELLLPSTGQRHTVVCYALKTTGLELVDEITKVLKTGISRSNTMMDTVDERSALENFLSWLEEVKGNTDGIILANYDSNSLEIPVLLIALRRHSLTDCFKHIVIGFCNTYTIFLADLKIRHYTLQAFYEQFIGRRPEKYRAQEDAIDLHSILTKYFKTEQLSIEIPRLVQTTYTVRCMKEYFSWRETTEPHRVGLMTIAASCNMQEMLKEVLVNNLMAAGYTHKRLADEYSMYGDRKFKHRLEQNILRMKSRYESHLTDTKIMSASSVTNRVLEHFRRLF